MYSGQSIGLLFTSDWRGYCIDNQISFLNFSDHADYYHWTFDNQGESYVEEPTFEFSILNGNDFYVCLEATNDIGCIDTDCQTVTLPEVFFFYVLTRLPRMVMA
ncbi:MAG: PKD domain-containing protein [Flavobacteriales bacterium]